MLINKCSICLLAILFAGSNLFGQCVSQVVHYTGTTVVGGTNVTASSSGDINMTSFCTDAQPYHIGNFSTGSYTFQFSPAVDSLTLNFSSIHYAPGYQEIVTIHTNGSHYSIPALGTPNSCSQFLPILTNGGNLAGQPTGQTSGCNGISIPGPISEITIIDSVILDSIITGYPGGSLFSLFICPENTTSVSGNDLSEIVIYPVPASDRITIRGLTGSNTDLRLFNCLGKQYSHSIVTTAETTLAVSDLPSGIYSLVILTEGKTITKKVMIASH